MQWIYLLTPHQCLILKRKMMILILIFMISLIFFLIWSYLSANTPPLLDLQAKDDNPDLDLNLRLLLFHVLNRKGFTLLGKKHQATWKILLETCHLVQCETKGNFFFLPRKYVTHNSAQHFWKKPSLWTSLIDVSHMKSRQFRIAET